MDKKAWWLRIKHNYPFAFADCIKWFQKTSRDYWRTDLQDTQKLLEYFEWSYILVDLRRLAKDRYWQYGYKVADASTTIIKDAIFDLPEAAYLDALELAFRCREQFLRRHTNFNAPKRPSQKRHKRDREPEVRVLLKKGDILYPIPSSDGHPIGEDEIRNIPQNATVKRNGKVLTVPDLMVAYKAYLEEKNYFD